MAKAKRLAVKKRAPQKYVTMLALGNSELRIALKKGVTLGKFIAGNIPKQWNLDNFALRVNDREVNNVYVLNDGDRITAAPNVAGG